MRHVRTGFAATCASLLLFAFPQAGVAVAQDPHGGDSGSMEAELRKKAEEISRLMRESEQLLLSITRVDDLVARQEEIARRLAELQRDPPPTPATTDPAETPEEARARRERERAELEQQNADIRRRLGELFERQSKAGEESVAKLIELLASLPQGGAGGNRDRPPPQGKQREEEQQKEQKQEQPKAGQDQRDQRNRERRGSEREPEKTADGARIRRIEAWIATLPPALQDRINRNDLSAIPLRYRRLVREYTALRAQREGEGTGGG